MRTADPTVSVLMPARNRACFVRAAVESVLAQTLDDLELIVVDDGSTDDTVAVVRAVPDDRIRILEGPQRGIAAALNVGLAAARGHLIARLDSDDLWLPHMLETVAAVVVDQHDVGLAYARCEFIGEDGSEIGGARGLPLPYPGDPLRSLLRADYTASVSSVIPRAVLEAAAGWDEGLRFGEDWDLALRVARAHRVVYVDRVVARIRRHGGNSVDFRSPGFERRLAERGRVIEKALTAEPGRAERGLRALAYRNLHTGAGLQMLSLRRYPAAWKCFREAVRTGGNPLRTIGRIAWSACNWFVVGRSPRISRFATAVVRRLRRAGTEPRRAA